MFDSTCKAPRTTFVLTKGQVSRILISGGKGAFSSPLCLFSSRIDTSSVTCASVLLNMHEQQLLCQGVWVASESHSFLRQFRLPSLRRPTDTGDGKLRPAFKPSFSIPHKPTPTTSPNRGELNRLIQTFFYPFHGR